MKDIGFVICVLVALERLETMPRPIEEQDKAWERILAYHEPSEDGR